MKEILLVLRTVQADDGPILNYIKYGVTEWLTRTGNSLISLKQIFSTAGRGRENH